jgi:hypothetical protein
MIRQTTVLILAMLLSILSVISLGCGSNMAPGPDATIGAHGQPLADPTARIATAEQAGG